MRAVKSAILAILLLAVCADPAEATKQPAERIRIGGRERALHVEPLRPFLTARPRLARMFPAEHSGHWRGYVATWTIRDGHLWLESMQRPGDGNESHPVPLSALFPGAKGRILARWYSGELRLPEGAPIRRFDVRFGVLHERTMLIRVCRGRIIGRRVVSHRMDAAFRSTLALGIAALADFRVPNRTRWVDLREIAWPELQARIRPGALFRTRGRLWEEESGPVLWSLATPSTPEIRYALHGLEGMDSGDFELGAFECLCSWRRLEGEIVLDVRRARALRIGERVHHPTFPTRAMKRGVVLRQWPPDEEGIAYPWADVVPMYQDSFVDDDVWLSAPLIAKDGRTTMSGVEIAQPALLSMLPLHARGILQKWVITEDVLRRSAKARRLYGDLGPGTYWRLVDPKTGKLAVPSPETPLTKEERAYLGED